MTAPDPTAVERCRRWAEWYWNAGWNPLPKRTDRNAPWLRRYAKLRDDGVGRSILGRWWSDGLHLCCGGRWRLAVVDLDGPEAAEVWSCWTLHRPAPPTWRVRSGGGGLHLYFRYPTGVDSLASGFLWQGEGKHEAVELLADRSLVVAPPSVHPGTGRPYEFLPGSAPADVRRPAPLPAWLLAVAAGDRRRPDPPPRVAVARPASRAGGRRYRFEDVTRAVDPLAVASEWGLRLVDRRPNDDGWVRCRAVGREDARPSAMFSAATGRYWEPCFGRYPISLFDLGVALGRYATAIDCRDDLGRRYLGARHAG